MRLSGTITFCLAGCVICCTLAHAGDSFAAQNPYTAIAQRNVFGLEPQAPIVEPPPPEAPLPKITLDGFMTVFGRPQALFKVVTPKTPAGNNPVESSFVLGENEEQDDIKIVQIDMTTGTVTFSNHGTVQEISLTDRR